MDQSPIYVVYFTTYYGTCGLPAFYIGSTKKDRIAKGYRGSVSSQRWSKLWKSAVANEPSKFSTIILGEYTIRREAILAEAHLQILLNVVKNEHFVNLAIAGVHPRNSGVGRPMSQRTRDALRMANLGAKRSEESKAKMREAAKTRPPTSEAAKAKMRESAKTRVSVKHSEESKGKISLAAKRRGPMSAEHKAKIAESVRLAKAH